MQNILMHDRDIGLLQSGRVEAITSPLDVIHGTIQQLHEEFQKNLDSLQLSGYDANPSKTKLLDELSIFAVARSTGRVAERHGEPGAPSLARSGLNWLDLAAPGAIAGSIWPRMARSACSWHPCWVDLAALCGPGRPPGSIWLSNECPIDTISQKESICLSTIMLRCCLLRAL